MAIHTRIPPVRENPPIEQIIPLPPVLRPGLGSTDAPRSLVEQIIEQLIASLDTADGDYDREEDDPAEEDDPGGLCDEDEVNTAFSYVKYTEGAHGPGCPFADPGGSDLER